MTEALCINYGEIKYGAICSCPKCDVSSTGNMNLDMFFSGWQFTEKILKKFGGVVKTINSACDDPETCFWVFMHYFREDNPDPMRFAPLKGERKTKVAKVLESVFCNRELLPLSANCN